MTKGEENAWIDNSHRIQRKRMERKISTKRCKQIASVFPGVFEEKGRHQGNEIIYNRINTSLLKETAFTFGAFGGIIFVIISPCEPCERCVFVSFCMKALEVKMVRQRRKGGKISHYELWPCFSSSSQEDTKEGMCKEHCDDKCSYFHRWNKTSKYYKSWRAGSSLSRATDINDDTMMPKAIIAFHLCHPSPRNYLVVVVALVISIPIPISSHPYNSA